MRQMHISRQEETARHQPENWRAPTRELAKGVGKAREPQKRAQASQSVFLSPDQVLQATSKERWTPGLLKARTMREALGQRFPGRRKELPEETASAASVVVGRICLLVS